MEPIVAAPIAAPAAPAPPPKRHLPNLPADPVQLYEMTFGGIDDRALGMQQKARTLAASYDGFFDQLTIRRGWRVPNFQRDEVALPFSAASQIVVLIREGIDRTREEGVVLRQLEGSSVDFLWGWPAGTALVNDVALQRQMGRGLVLATLSDAKGLVEGLTEQDIEGYLRGHPMFR